MLLNYLRKDLICDEVLKDKITILGKANTEFFQAFHRFKIHEYLEKYSVPTKKIGFKAPEGIEIPGLDFAEKYDINFYFPEVGSNAVTETVFIYCENITIKQFEALWNHFDCRSVYAVNILPHYADAILQCKFNFEKYINLLQDNNLIKISKEISDRLEISTGHLADLKRQRIKFSIKIYKKIAKEFPLTPFEFLLDYEDEAVNEKN